MTADSGSRLPGRRHNGLAAGSFDSVGDVDPRVGEHLLDVLLLNGIAAYLQPTIDHDAFTRAVSLPGQPTDRLWVDRSKLSDAKRLVTREVDDAGHTAKPPTASSPVDDAAWAQIVATFDQKTTTAIPPWPVDEDTDDDDADADAAPVAPTTQTVQREPEIGADDGADEGYVPPPPPPVARPSKRTALALIIIAVGLAVILWPGLLGFADQEAFLTGMLAVAAGIGYLFWNLRDGPADHDRPDDGAVI